jgi:hypothetical protein
MSAIWHLADVAFHAEYVRSRTQSGHSWSTRCMALQDETDAYAGTTSAIRVHFLTFAVASMSAYRISPNEWLA